MIEVFEFIFSDILHFIGTIIILDIAFSGTERIIKAIKNNRNDRNDILN